MPLSNSYSKIFTLLSGYTAAYQALLVIGEASKSLLCTTLGSKLRQPNNFLKEEIKL